MLRTTTSHERTLTLDPSDSTHSSLMPGCVHVKSAAWQCKSSSNVTDPRLDSITHCIRHWHHLKLLTHKKRTTHALVEREFQQLWSNARHACILRPRTHAFCSVSQPTTVRRVGNFETGRHCPNVVVVVLVDDAVKSLTTKSCLIQTTRKYFGVSLVLLLLDSPTTKAPIRPL